MGMLEILNEMTDPEQGGNAVNPDQVKESGIGGIVMLYRMKDKNPHVKNIAMKIVDRRVAFPRLFPGFSLTFCGLLTSRFARHFLPSLARQCLLRFCC